jgi:hypothetical protein
MGQCGVSADDQGPGARRGRGGGGNRTRRRVVVPSRNGLEKNRNRNHAFRGCACQRGCVKKGGHGTLNRTLGGVSISWSKAGRGGGSTRSEERKKEERRTALPLLVDGVFSWGQRWNCSQLRPSMYGTQRAQLSREGSRARQFPPVPPNSAANH